MPPGKGLSPGAFSPGRKAWPKLVEMIDGPCPLPSAERIRAGECEPKVILCRADRFAELPASRKIGRNGGGQGAAGAMRIPRREAGSRKKPIGVAVKQEIVRRCAGKVAAGDKHGPGAARVKEHGGAAHALVIWRSHIAAETRGFGEIGRNESCERKKMLRDRRRRLGCGQRITA